MTARTAQNLKWSLETRLPNFGSDSCLKSAETTTYMTHSPSEARQKIPSRAFVILSGVTKHQGLPCGAS